MNVPAQLLKSFAEFAALKNVNYNKVHPLSGEMAGKLRPVNYINGPEKYSINKMNLSCLSLPLNDLSHLILASGYPCERMLYSGAPYVQ